MNAVTGMWFYAEFPIFEGGSFSRWGKRGGRFIKNVKITGIITSAESYEEKSKKHWIWFKVETSNDELYYKIGKEYKKQGKNFYASVKNYEYPENYEEMAEQKKQSKIYHGIEIPGDHLFPK